jgi:hypothetical protein
MKKLLLAILTASALSFAHAEDWTPLIIGPFGGLNNRDHAFSMPANQAQDLLNVDITPGGKSVKKRKGTSQFTLLTPSTSPIHGTHFFYDPSGNDVALYFHERKISSSINGDNTPDTIYSTATNNAVYDCVDNFGSAYCVNTSTDGLFVTDGVTVSTIGVVSTGTMVAITPTRLVQAGFAGSIRNRIDFSKENDFTTWTVGGAPTDPITFTITSPGSEITHITYVNKRVHWFKESSFGYILEAPELADWRVVMVSADIGTLDNTSVIDTNGNLYFRGQDKHIYVYDGSTVNDLSEEIPATIALSTQTASEKSYGIFFDNKLWWSIAYGSAQTTNNRVLIYDFEIPGWTIYSLPVNGFYVRRNTLYFVSSSSGTVNSFGTSESDVSAAIEAYWRSKDFFVGSPFNYFDLVNISVSADAVTNSTVTVTYVEDGQTESTFTMSLDPQNYPFLNGTTISKNRNIAATSGAYKKTLAIEIGNNAADQPFEIFSIQAGVRSKPWKPIGEGAP